MTFENCFTAFLIALFVLVVFVMLPNFPRKQTKNVCERDGVLKPWDEMSKAEKLEDVE